MPSFTDRHFRGLLLLIWAFGCALMLLAGRDSIAAWRMGDPDDQLRLLQVRDWIAGQSWWDITQYRFNLPRGGNMHWSRLVDIPIAFIILLCRPFFGIAVAEHIAVVVVPLMTFGAVLALYAATARRLFGNKAAILAAVLFITILPAVFQLMPMRIDHHGWQLALFFGAILALFDTERQLRGALIIGAALALWMEISIEGLPFGVLFMGILGWRWLTPPVQAQSENQIWVFPVAMISLASVSAICFVSTEPWTQYVTYCDSLSPVHIITFTVIALILAAGTFGMTRSGHNGISTKLLVAACAAIAGGSVFVVQAPQCAGDAFSQLDPLVREYWFNRTAEGLPIWDVGLSVSIQAISAIVAGVIAIVYIWLSPNILPRKHLVPLAMLFLGTAIIGSAVIRTSVYAVCLSTLMTSAMAIDIFRRSDEMKRIWSRLALKTIAMALAVPILLGQNLLPFLEKPQPLKLVQMSDDDFIESVGDCQKLKSVRALSVLPKANIMVGLDTAPAILQVTNHNVIATGHHRNEVAMGDVIRTFTGSSAVAEKIITARKVDYLIICDGSFELALYAAKAPNGFLGQLRSGQIPRWLAPLPDIGPFQIFRVALPAKPGGVGGAD